MLMGQTTEWSTTIETRLLSDLPSHQVGLIYSHAGFWEQIVYPFLIDIAVADEHPVTRLACFSDYHFKRIVASFPRQ